MENFVIYSIIILVIASIFYLYNIKKNKILLIAINIFFLIISLVALVIQVNLKIDPLICICVFIYVGGINLINVQLNKNIKMKKYVIFALCFYLLSNAWFFLLAFIILIIGILTDSPGL